MKVIVIHPSLDTIALLDGLSQCNMSMVAYCAGAADAIRELRQTKDPSTWVLIEGDGRHPDGTEIAGIIRAAGFDAPICYVSHRPEPSTQSDRAQVPICAVEQTHSGLQILRCALHRSGKTSDNRAERTASAQDEPFVFEYHAPCGKRA